MAELARKRNLQMNIRIIPARFRNSVKKQFPARIIDLSGSDLPTNHPVGAYIAGQEARSSKSSMLNRLAAALCAMEESVKLVEVSDEASLFYHQQVLRVNWGETTREWMLGLCHRLNEVGYAVSTRKMTITAVRGVLAECRMSGLMSAEAYFRATENLPRIRGTSVPKGRAVGPGEITKMFHVFDQDPKPARGIRDQPYLV